MRTSLVGDYEKRQKEVLGNNGLYNRLEKNNLLVSGLETELDLTENYKEKTLGVFGEVDQHRINYTETLDYIKEKRGEIQEITSRVKRDVIARISPLHGFFYKITGKDLGDLSELVDQELVVLNEMSERFGMVASEHESVRLDLNSFYSKICFTLDNCEKKRGTFISDRQELKDTLENISKKSNVSDGRYVLLATAEKVKDKKTEVETTLIMNENRYKFFSENLPEVGRLKEVFNSTAQIFKVNNDNLSMYKDMLTGEKRSLVSLIEAGQLSKELKKALESLNSKMETVYLGVSKGVEEVSNVYKEFKFPKHGL